MHATWSRQVNQRASQHEALQLEARPDRGVGEHLRQLAWEHNGAGVQKVALAL